MILSRRLSGIDAHIWVWTRRLVVKSLDELHSDGKEIAARLLSNITSTCSLSHECVKLTSPYLMMQMLRPQACCSFRHEQCTTDD